MATIGSKTMPSGAMRKKSDWATERDDDEFVPMKPGYTAPPTASAPVIAPNQQVSTSYTQDGGFAKDPMRDLMLKKAMERRAIVEARERELEQERRKRCEERLNALDHRNDPVPLSYSRDSRPNSQGSQPFDWKSDDRGRQREPLRVRAPYTPSKLEAFCITRAMRQREYSKSISSLTNPVSTSPSSGAAR